MCTQLLAATWTDFQIVSQRRISSLSGEAQEFSTSFTIDNSPYQGISYWYVLGRYKVSVFTVADAAIWTFTQYDGIESTLEGVQESFQPARSTSETYGYSVAHPPGWEVSEEPAYDYWGHDPATDTPRVYVLIASASEYTSIQSYGPSHTVTNADILSRQLVFSGRPNPSYRIDYQYLNESEVRFYRGAVLITIVGENAIWVFVDDLLGNWTEIQGLVDDIFLRVAFTS